MPVAIYFRAADTVLHALLRSEQGVYIAGLPAVVVRRLTGPEELCDALRQVLARSRGTVPHPTDWKAVGQPVLATVQVSSWKALARRARYCTVSETESELVFMPTRNGGSSGADKGFHELSDKQFSLQRDAPDGALIEALARAEAACG